jgi:ribosomal protein S27E
MVSYLNIVSKLDKNDNYKGKRKISSNSQLSDSDNSMLCSICKSNQIITDTESGELICSKCGQVISDKVQQAGPEWRNFTLSSNESNDSRSSKR